MLFRFPEVKLTIQGMTHQIVTALSDYNKDIETHIHTEIEKSIATYDFDKEVKEEADRQLKVIVGDSVKELFSWETREEIKTLIKDFVLRKLNK